MKKLFMVLAATVICGACLFTSCKKDEDTTSLNLEDKIIGKWMYAVRNGEPTPTNKKKVFNFVSPNKAYVSISRGAEASESGKWLDHSEADVVIDGNKLTVTTYPDEHTTLEDEFIITDINDTEFSAHLKVTVTVDCTVERVTESNIGLAKVTADYSAAILGTWQGHCTSEGSVFDDGQEHRWQYRADGSYVYYRKDGQAWVPYGNDFAEYFVDGNLLCTRWRNSGEQTENREWWEITVDGPRMHWIALRQNPDGSTFTATFEMEKVN